MTATHNSNTFFYVIIRRPRRSTLFPCTTLFRSGVGARRRGRRLRPRAGRRDGRGAGLGAGAREPPLDRASLAPALKTGRSEEHTPELQSRQYLVCRLLLEKQRNTYSERS